MAAHGPPRTSLTLDTPGGWWPPTRWPAWSVGIVVHAALYAVRQYYALQLLPHPDKYIGPALDLALNATTTFLVWQIMRLNYRRWTNLQIIGVIVVLCIAFSPLRSWVQRHYLLLPHYRADEDLLGVLDQVNFVLYATNASVTAGIYFFSDAQRQRRARAALETDKLRAELQFLKAQIKPHFLLNTLNNLYAITQLKPDLAPPLLLKLAAMLRYVLYDCRADLVPIAKERAYIAHYIDLFVLKTEAHVNLTQTWHLQNAEALIPPMIIQPLVENALKHSQILHQPEAEVAIEVMSDTHQLHLHTRNTISPVAEAALSDEYGIGLENIHRRLQAQFRGAYQFSTRQEGNWFYAQLTLPLSHVHPSSLRNR